MIRFKWTFNGRRIAPGQLGREVTRSIQSEILNRAKKSMEQIRCPVHRVAPRNLRVHQGGGRLRFEYEACCDSP